MKRNPSIFDPLLTTENTAKQNAPKKTVRPTTNPENSTSNNLPLVIMTTIPKKPKITLNNLMRDKGSFRIRLANKTI